ncbi:hypothetical protein [Pantoea agglomerans]|uniref:hypothetical protein n=1 Tax=Enterobacter agglomerans TaxID=549 RepID=UPI0007E53346|nr:hypothetical protein [Pantoea agglomerans]WHU86701.1 hypothetical protein A7P62_12445 [Pantoea agglomerans pv. gypsophilae]
MIRRIYDVFVKVAIGVLLVLSLWLVIVGAYKKNIGNLSDWISAMSTFGTLIVAYMAFKSAPKWIHQKMDEQALNQAVTLISRDIPELKRLMQFVTDEVLDFLIFKDLADDEVQIDYYFDEFCKSFSKNESSINEIKNMIFKLERDFNALSKIGWNLVPPAEEKFRLMRKSTYYLLKRYTSILRLIERYNAFHIKEDSMPSTKAKQSIMNISDSVDGLYEKFYNDLESFYQYANNVPLYFEGK